MNILFVQVKERPFVELNEREVIILMKEINTNNDHYDEAFRISVAIDPSSDMKQMYNTTAKSILELKNNHKIDQVVFDTQVIYNRDGSEGRTRNTYEEQIRQAYRKLLNIS